MDLIQRTNESLDTFMHHTYNIHQKLADRQQNLANRMFNALEGKSAQALEIAQQNYENSYKYRLYMTGSERDLARVTQISNCFECHCSQELRDTLFKILETVFEVKPSAIEEYQERKAFESKLASELVFYLESIKSPLIEPKKDVETSQ